MKKKEGDRHVPQHHGSFQRRRRHHTPNAAGIEPWTEHTHTYIEALSKTPEHTQHGVCKGVRRCVCVCGKVS